MKRLIFSGWATLSLALGAFGQGEVDIYNGLSSYGVAINRAGNYYAGTYGLELWVLNGTNVPASINSATNVAAYGDLAAAGFTLAETWSGQTMSTHSLGTLLLGVVSLPIVKPPGSKAVLALAVWTGNSLSWGAAVSAGAEGGVVAFVDQTVDYTIKPPPIPHDLAQGWDAYGKDLVMTPLAYPANTAPVLAPIADQVAYSGTLLSFKASATDADQPPQSLTFSLGAGAPAGAGITPGGLFTWTPTAAQAPSTNLITVTVTDNGVPPLSDSKSFTVVVYAPNTPPVLAALANQNVYANTLLSFTASATEIDQPPRTLTFSLGPGAPAGAGITPGGIFTWTPAAAQAPSTNLITVTVTDNGVPPLSDSASFTVVVYAPNTPPVLAALANRSVHAGSLLSFTASATDSDQPPQTLTFSLGPGAPAGAGITPGGLFTWMPAAAQAPSTNLITVTVTDNGVPPLSDSKSFKVLVWAPIGPAALEVNNADAHHGIAVDEDGNYYMGDYGLELWVLNGTNVPASINSTTNVVAYGDLAAAGFTLAQTWSGEAMSRDFAGTLLLGGVGLPMVEPAGSKVALALAAWAGDATSWVAAVGAGAKGGVIAFVNGTVDASVLPPPVPPDLAAGWDACGEDLVMTPLAHPPNTPPVLATLADQNIYANTLLSFTASATDTDQPPQSLTFSLGPGAPAGAGITPGGLFTWTPAAAQAPSTNLITVTVTDNGVPPLSDSKSFTVVVYAPNTPPVLAALANQNVYANTLLSFTASATDTDQPPQTLTFSLGPGAPAGASITPGGLFTWIPAAAQAPSTNLITVTVTDNGVPPLSDSASFTVVVYAPNTPPVLAALANQNVYANTLLSFAASATDTDQPPQTLTFSLGPGAPAGAGITPGGLFTWTPTAAQAPSTNLITVTVTDNGVPPLSGSASFTVVVYAPNTPPVLAALANRSVDAGSLLSFTASATDTDQPPQTLTFSLARGAGGGGHHSGRPVYLDACGGPGPEHQPDHGDCHRQRRAAALRQRELYRGGLCAQYAAGPGRPGQPECLCQYAAELHGQRD